jgi:hypothetical protein
VRGIGPPGRRRISGPVYEGEEDGKSTPKVPQLVIGIKNALKPQNQICGFLNYTKSATRDISVVLTPVLVYLAAELA